MADITLTCGSCGNRITVSEYVDAEFMTCGKCRARVAVPRKPPEQSAAARLKLAASMPAGPAESAPPAPPAPVDAVRQNTPFMKRLRRRPRRRAGWGVALGAYAVFALFAAGLLYLRYSSPPGWQAAARVGGLWALLLMHLSVIVYAFADDAFHGIMCVIIPGYTIYYLFIHSDRFFQRAVVAALLLAFGLDAVQTVTRFTQSTLASFSTWMQEGGGELKSIDVTPPH